MNLSKINFRQPKYIFPAVIAVPLVALIYFVGDIFGGPKVEEEPTDRINVNLPEANISKDYDKLRSMENRYEKEMGNLTAIDAIGQEETGKDRLDDEYSEEEMRKLIEETERKQREQQRLAEMQRNLTESSNRLERTGRNRNNSRYDDDDYDVERRLDEIQNRSRQRVRSLLQEVPDPDEEERAEANRLAREREAQQAKQQEEQPCEVVKASMLSHAQFNTIDDYAKSSESPLIQAMIDKTTKSTDGTRLRFKLLDDVIIDDVKLLKGSYIYGTVTGFSAQRVMANITSILVGDRFLKVNLSVYDIDGMEGFYVPASSFREFIQNATAGVASQNINFNDNSNSDRGINAQSIALQALQNIYQAGSSAISKNAKKNKAKIKYNTIVYLINSNSK